MSEVLVIFEWGEKHEHIIMPKKVANIYVKFIKINSKKFTSVDDGVDMYMKHIKVKCFDDQKIIAAYKTLRKITDTSSLNIADLLFDCMIRNIEDVDGLLFDYMNGNTEDTPFDVDEMKDIAKDIGDTKFICYNGSETSKLTKQHYKFIIKYEKEILYHMKGPHF